jgi:hypothetical protein
MKSFEILPQYANNIIQNHSELNINKEQNQEEKAKRDQEIREQNALNALKEGDIGKAFSSLNYFLDR